MVSVRSVAGHARAVADSQATDGQPVLLGRRCRWPIVVNDTNRFHSIATPPLSVDHAAGLMTVHTHRTIVYAAIRASTAGALYAIRRNGFEIVI